MMMVFASGKGGKITLRRPLVESVAQTVFPRPMVPRKTLSAVSIPSA
jgi:hypothetical protein